MNPPGPAVRSSTTTLGSPVPSLDHVVLAPCPAAAVNTPWSVPSARLPLLSTRASPGMSGRFPEMLVQVTPPLVVSNTCPMPPPGIHRRENPPNTAYACAGLVGSTVTPEMYRFGRPAMLIWCQVPP